MANEDKYQELAKLFHQDASSSRMLTHEREYAKRFNADSTFKLGLSTPNGELFIAVPRELSIRTQQVLRTERHITGFLAKLPNTAKSALLKSLVLDEVVSTNAIEDIHSTRQQVKDALEATAQAPAPAKRFRELALLYLDVIEGRSELPRTPEEIRAIYDKVTAGEIAPADAPDGKLFRAKGVSIVQAGSRTVHAGVEPESKIIANMEAMLDLVRNEEIPPLFQAIASHFVFEYTHPFYDGNGRTGRYLLSLMLTGALSTASALNVSRVIADNRARYYKAFKTAEDPLNKGELTFFVMMTLELIQDAQRQTLVDLDWKFDALGRAEKLLSTLPQRENLKSKELEIVTLLAQCRLFGLHEALSLGEIAQRLQLKEQMTRKHLATLENKGIACKAKKKNPVSFTLAKEFMTKYGLDD